MTTVAQAAADATFLYEDQMLDKLLPLVGISGILIFAFIVIMIVITIVRRSRDILQDKSIHTHIAFNQGLDQVNWFIDNKEVFWLPILISVILRIRFQQLRPVFRIRNFFLRIRIRIQGKIKLRIRMRIRIPDPRTTFFKIEE